MRFEKVFLLIAAVALAAACENASEPGSKGAAPPSSAAAGAPAAASPALRRDALEGGPYPTLLVAQAQFRQERGPDGKERPVPGPAKLLIVRHTPSGWKVSVLEDGDSNVFHKALPEHGGFLTIGGNQAMLKSWRFDGGAWKQQTHWNPHFGGRFDRLRDIERGDVDGDGAPDLVIATHDQGVIAIVHPTESWRVERIFARPDTFVHEIELGDVDGDGRLEIFATPSQPNKLDKEQPGEVLMFRRDEKGTWQRSVVDAPADTHAKEILAADVDGDGVSELFAVWEGAIASDGTLKRPVTVKEYRWKRGAWESRAVGTIPDRQTRAIAAGDVNGDGKVDLVAGALSSGLWLFQQKGEGWEAERIARDSSGFEQPVLVTDLDGDGAKEIYVASEDQAELRRYRWKNGSFEKTVLARLVPGDITWNITAARL